MKAQAPKTTSKTDVYTRVTERIVADLEQGVRPWLKPWSSGQGSGQIARPVRHNGLPYSGINVVLLWSDAMAKGFNAPMWMTYKQAEQLGAHVRKGESGSLVVYADRYTKTETNETGEAVDRNIPFMKAYTVFNIEQIEGLPESYRPVPVECPEPFALIEAAEAFFAGTGAAFHHGGNRAFYSVGGDFIQLPPPQVFRDAESYTATKAHELIHWSGHETRMARTFGKRFGDSAYAFEELVAELGSAFLCAALGVAPEPREDHAAYLASWLKVLKEDKRAIFKAAAHAQRAADFLEGLQGKTETREDGELEAA